MADCYTALRKLPDLTDPTTTIPDQGDAGELIRFARQALIYRHVLAGCNDEFGCPDTDEHEAIDALREALRAIGEDRNVDGWDRGFGANPAGRCPAHVESVWQAKLDARRAEWDQEMADAEAARAELAQKASK